MFMKDISKIERIGNIYGFTGGSFAGMVYGVNGCAPALNTMGGGRREPLILEFQSTQLQTDAPLPSGQDTNGMLTLTE